MRTIALAFLVALAGCGDSMLGLVVQAADEQPTDGATTWQAELPFLAAQCLKHTAGEVVTAGDMASGGYTARTSPLGDDFFQKTITKRSVFGEFYNVSFVDGGPTIDYDNRRSCRIGWADDKQPLAPFAAELSRALSGLGYQRTKAEKDRFGNDVGTFAGPNRTVEMVSYKISETYGPTAYIIAMK